MLNLSLKLIRHVFHGFSPLSRPVFPYITTQSARNSSTINLAHHTRDSMGRSNFTAHHRGFSGTAVNYGQGEEKIRRILKEKFPLAVEIEVEDVSGGCGSMYQIYIEAEEFRGKKLVEQQRMVNQVLEKEIAEMHGLSLQTAVPKK